MSHRKSDLGIQKTFQKVAAPDTAREGGLLDEEKIGQGHQHTASAEADDVGSPVPVYVGKQARVRVVAAPTGGRSEAGKLERGGRKVPASGGQGHQHTGSAEADDVGSPVPVYVGKQARVR